MLVGFPGAGKTHYIRQMSHILNASPEAWTVLSTDNYIELVAMEAELTYNQVFKDAIGPATTHLNEQLIKAVKEGRNIIWDQTNLTVKSRKSKLAKLPTTYFKQAVIVQCTTFEEWRKRLDSRPGKTIPEHVLASMTNSFEMPTIEEGFDNVEAIFT